MLKFDNGQEQKRTMICRTLSIFIPLFFQNVNDLDLI